jgi:ABC-type dipeptide/oligopeptide/nickel transport system permease subunit
MTVARLDQRMVAAPAPETKSRSELLQSWRRFRANRAALVGLIFIVLICIGAVLANVLVPYDPNYSYPGMRGVGPSWEHPLGFDHIGRDLMARVVYGSRVALLVGLGATAISVVLGVLARSQAILAAGSTLCCRA